MKGLLWMLPTCKVFLLNLIEKFCYLLHNVFHYNLNERNTLNVFHLDFNETNMFYNITILRTFFTFFRTIFFPQTSLTTRCWTPGPSCLLPSFSIWFIRKWKCQKSLITSKTIFKGLQAENSSGWKNLFICSLKQALIYDLKLSKAELNFPMSKLNVF